MFYSIPCVWIANIFQEVTIKQLREKIKTLEEDSNSVLAEKSKEKEKELRLDFAEKETRMEEEKRRLESKVVTAEEEVFALRSALAVAQQQLMEVKSSADRIAVAKGSEYELGMLKKEILILSHMMLGTY